MQKSLLVVSLFALSACSIVQPRPQIEKRFSSMRDGPALPEPPLSLSVSSTDPEDPPAKPKKEVKLNELSDRGQAALITATGGKPPFSIEGKGADKGGGGGIKSLTSISRLLVVAPVPAGFLKPGDRVDAMRISLRVDPKQSADWKIVGWDAVANKYESREIASVTDEASSKLTASTGLGLGPLLPEAQVGGELARSSKSEYKVFDYSYLDAQVTPDGTAWVLQSAGAGKDLAHNSAVQVRLQYVGPTYLINYNTYSKLYDEPTDGEVAKPLEPTKVSVTVVRVEAPQDRNAVCGQAKMAYRVRGFSNDKGRSTLTEYDDAAELTVYDENVTANQASFFMAPPPQTRFFHIFVGINPVHYKASKSSQPQDLAFASLDEAIAFIAWLQAVDFDGTDLREGQIGLAGNGPNLQPIGKSRLGELTAGLKEITQKERMQFTESRCS